MVEQPIYIKLLSWFTGLIPAIIGSAISLRLASENVSFPQRVMAFFIGIAIAHYVGWAIIEAFTIQPESFLSSCILFVVGIFGVTTVSEISKQLPELIRGFFAKVMEFIK